MSSNMANIDDESTSLLNESTFEILSESSFSLTDEEGEDGGSSVNSFDDESMDDLSNIGDTDSLEGFSTAPREHSGIPSFGGLDEYQLDNTITLKDDAASPTHIEFDEPMAKSGTISVVHTLQEFSAEDTALIATQLKLANAPEKLVSTVRQAMSQDLLCLDEPFRFLYVGNTCAKEEIFNKLGAALALPIVECTSSTTSSDSKSSRFNVIPVSSFGMKSSGEVELIESFGVEMALDVCTQAVRTKVSGKPDTLSICLNGNSWIRSVHNGGKFVLEPSAWKIPHLAVVFCAEADTLEDKLTRVYIRSFLGRYSIPTLVITQKSLCLKPSTESWTLDTQSLHMCLESQTESGEHFVHKRLPIDLATFNNIDARQMNRNLACITGLVSTKADLSASSLQEEGGVSKKGDGNATEGSFLDVFRGDPKKPRDLVMVFAVSWLVLCGLVGGLFATAYMKYSVQESHGSAWSGIGNANLVPVHSSISSINTAAITTSVITEINTVIAQSVPTSCESLTEPVKPLPNTKDGSSDRAQKFEAHIIGDNSIILRPPTDFKTLKKQANLEIHVSRRGEQIESQISQLFDGVYTLVIPADQAWGLISVKVRAQTPSIDETLDLDFGIPWLRLDAWKKFATKRQSDAAKIAKDAVKIADQATKIAEHMSNTGPAHILKNINEKKHSLEIQALELVSAAKELKRDMSSKAKKIYRDNSIPLKALVKQKGLGYIGKAQRQALRIWGNIVDGDAQTEEGI